MKDLLSNTSISGKTKSIYKIKTFELYTVKTRSRCNQACLLKHRERGKEKSYDYQWTVDALFPHKKKLSSASFQILGPHNKPATGILRENLWKFYMENTFLKQ